jgi:hypothetical protein
MAYVCPECGEEHGPYRARRPCDGACPACGGDDHERWDCPNRLSESLDVSELGGDARRAAELDPTIRTE